MDTATIISVLLGIWLGIVAPWTIPILGVLAVFVFVALYIKDYVL